MVDLQAVQEKVEAPVARERIEVRSISMYPSDWLLAETMADEMASNVSAALRFVVRQWAARQRARALGGLSADSGNGLNGGDDGEGSG